MTAKTYVRYDREVLYDEPEWIPASMKRQVLARMYEIRGMLNGVAVVEHEMTARNQVDALQRLRDRYQRLHGVDFETGEITPLAFAELQFHYAHDAKRRLVPTGRTYAVCWMAPTEDSDAPDLPGYVRDRWHVRDLDSIIIGLNLLRPRHADLLLANRSRRGNWQERRQGILLDGPSRS